MPATSYSELEATLQQARKAPTIENQRAAVDLLLQFNNSGNRLQQLRATGYLPELYELCTHYCDTIHEAIFDSCEDSKEDVRLAGYKALVGLSRKVERVRRKNADVLCQLLQSTGSELDIVRGCLSEHIRIAPGITYEVILEYLFTTSPDGNDQRSTFAPVVVSFLAGGGRLATVDATAQTGEILRKRDAEGGKGAITDISWFRKDTVADNILHTGLIRAIPCLLPDEAKQAVSVVLDLARNCAALSPEMDALLQLLVRISLDTFRKEFAQPSSNLETTLGWLDLSTTLIRPVVPPVESAGLNTQHPRANPTALLRALNTFILPHPVWNRLSLSRNAHRDLTSILGVALKSTRTLLETSRFSVPGHVQSEARTALEQTGSLSPHVLQSWVVSSAYNVDKGAAQGILELLKCVKLDPSFQQNPEVMEYIKRVHDRAGETYDGASHSYMRDVTRFSADILKAHKSAQPNAVIPLSGDDTNKGLAPGMTYESGLRKRVRIDSDPPARSSGANEAITQASKRPKLMPGTLLGRFTALNPSVPIQDVHIKASNTPPSSLDKTSPAVVGTELSIRGAASNKATQVNNKASHPNEKVTKAPPSEAPRQPPIISRIDGLRIQGASTRNEKQRESAQKQISPLISPSTGMINKATTEKQRERASPVSPVVTSNSLFARLSTVPPAQNSLSTLPTNILERIAPLRTSEEDKQFVGGRKRRK